MKWVFFFSLFILLAGCKQNPKDVSMELIPVRNTEYYGYINHKGEWVINQQFKSAFAFSEGLAIVQTSEDKYGFINTRGEYVIQPIYKNVKAFSEGLAAVVRENSMIEYINKKGEVVISLGPEIFGAGSFSGGLAKVNNDKLFGFIDKQGVLVIPFQYDFAFNFSEGLAEVVQINQKGEKTEKWLTGYIDTKGKQVINYQFEMGTRSAGDLDFSEGLALVKAGEQYGFVNKKGQYEINPQFKWAEKFNGDLAVIRQGDLYGYIDKKGKVVINPQFTWAGSFYNNALATVKSVTGKCGYIDKKGKFLITPQFERASRFYDDIAIIELGGKLGLINTKGEIIVNPQFESDLYIEPFTEHESNWPIYSDYFDLSSVISFIIDGASSTQFHGFSASTNFKTLQKRFPNLNRDNYLRFSDFPQSKTKNISLKEMHFGFPEGIMTYEDIYDDEQVYNPVLGGYTTQKRFIYRQESINENAKMGGVNLVFTLEGKAREKKEQIIDALVKSIKQLENENYTLLINGINSPNDLWIIVNFN